MKRILVTGGSGFIGSNYIHHVLKSRDDVSVVNIDKLTYAGNEENNKDLESDQRYIFVEGDICDVDLVSACVKEVDVIVHFAAESHVDRSISDPFPFVTTNVQGTQVLLDLALKHGKKRFHHVSTDEVYGSLDADATKKFSETTPYDPRSPYSASKAASDHLVRAYYHTYDLPVTISNCSNNYGSYQYPEKLIPLFVTNVIDGKSLPVYGTGENVRDWIHVDDHVRGIEAIIERGRLGETYCLGCNNELSNLEIAHRILSEFNLGHEQVQFVSDRRGHDFRYAIDFSKAARELDWSPQHSFDDGLRQTIEWYKQNEPWWRSVMGKNTSSTTKS